MAKWLDITKELPENKEFILFAVKDKVKFGCYRKIKNGKDKFIDFCTAKKVYQSVDGWQRLPEPPKKRKPVVVVEASKKEEASIKVKRGRKRNVK